MVREFYAGLDVGSSVCELVGLDEGDQQVVAVKMDTSARNLIAAVQEARRAHPGNWTLAVEEGELAQWVADLLREEVTRLVVSDPKRNAWIARDPGKNDRVDAGKLATLLKGRFVKEVFHSRDADRIEFKRAVQHYHEMTRAQSGLKSQIKSRLRGHGVIERGTEAFGRSREKVIQQLPPGTAQQVVRHLSELLDQMEKTQEKSRQLMVAIGRNFPEVARFQDVPGIGPVWACTFSAYIQTPHRFHSKRQVWRYCGLSITNRQSNGELLGRQRLDRAGVSQLKALSYRAFCSAMKGDNEFREFYVESLARTQDKTHARLNTQRKILTVLWAMWKNDEPYRPGGNPAEPKTERAEVR